MRRARAVGDVGVEAGGGRGGRWLREGGRGVWDWRPGWGGGRGGGRVSRAADCAAAAVPLAARSAAGRARGCARGWARRATRAPRIAGEEGAVRLAHPPGGGGGHGRRPWACRFEAGREGGGRGRVCRRQRRPSGCRGRPIRLLLMRRPFFSNGREVARGGGLATLCRVCLPALASCPTLCARRAGGVGGGRAPTDADGRGAAAAAATALGFQDWAGCLGFGVLAAPAGACGGGGPVCWACSGPVGGWACRRWRWRLALRRGVRGGGIAAVDGGGCRG